VADTDDFAQWMLEKFDLDGETVMVAPASGFYSTPGEGKNQVRIAYVLNKKRPQKIGCYFSCCFGTIPTLIDYFRKHIFTEIQHVWYCLLCQTFCCY
jgi:hypothetical protein